MAYKPRRTRSRTTYSARGRSSRARKPVARSRGRRSSGRSGSQVIRIVLQTAQSPGAAAQEMASGSSMAVLGRAKH